MKIAFIGLGNMGNPMCRNLLKHGHKLRIYDVVPELVKKLEKEGCEVATSAADCARGVEMIITMLPSSPHVRSVYLSEYGILKGAGATKVSEEKISLNSYPGRELQMSFTLKEGTEIIARTRIYLVDKRLYSITFMNVKSMDAALVADYAKKFFASFEVRGK